MPCGANRTNSGASTLCRTLAGSDWNPQSPPSRRAHAPQGAMAKAKVLHKVDAPELVRLAPHGMPSGAVR